MSKRRFRPVPGVRRAIVAAAGGALVATLVLLPAAGSAHADTGDLSVHGCVEDNDVGPDGCGTTANALEGVRRLAMTQDGTSVFTVSETDDALGILSRGAQFGLFTDEDCWDDDDTGDEGCGLFSETDGLDLPSSVAVSPDGRSVYVASTSDDAVVMFDRDPASGSVGVQGCIDDNEGTMSQGPDDCAQSTNGLDGANSVVVSPDGETVYASAFQDAAVVRFTRNTSTGVLTPQDCWDDNDTGADACGNTINGLGTVRSVAASADGRSLYAAAAGDDAVVRFTLDPGSGAITTSECVDDNDSGADNCPQTADGLNGVSFVTVSPEGNSVYSAAGEDAAIARFVRDPATGFLTAGTQDCIDDDDLSPETCSQSTDGLSAASGVAVSPDGLSVYASGFADDAVVRFDRVPSTGAITAAQQDCVDDNDSADPMQGQDDCNLSTDGLNAAASVAVTPDGRFVLVTSLFDNAIVSLQRDDDDPPETTIVAGPAEGSSTGDPTPNFAFASSEPLSTFQCRLDGVGGFSDCPAEYAPGPLAVGPHLLEVAAIDPSGNPDPVPASRSFTVVDVPVTVVDVAAPDTTIEGKRRFKTQRKKKRRSATFTLLSTEPGSALTCQLDSRPATPCTSPYRTPKLRGGAHRLVATATDAAGNADPSPATHSFRIKQKRRR